MRPSLSFLFYIDASVLALIIFILMLLCIAWGSWVGRRRKSKSGHEDNPANKSIFSAIFGLLAFLLAFTFSMSSSRFDARRNINVEEANAIGTAILRADLYPDSERNGFRNEFKEYLEARIAYLSATKDLAKMKAYHDEQDKAAAKLWSRAMRYSVKAPTVIPSGQMIPALNAMFDNGNANDYAELLKVPEPVVVMLILLLLINAFCFGYISVEKGKLDWYIAVMFCLLTSLVAFITFDLDRPRRGLVNSGTSRQSIISLMDQLK